MTLSNDPALPKRLSVELMDLANRYEHSDVLIGELMARLEGRVYTLFLVMLSIPFCQPLAIPGVSTLFGIIIALLGLRFALRQHPWLPKRLMETRIPARFLPKVLRAGGKVLSGLEKALHPRMTYIFDYRLTQFLAGMVIFISGVLLLLPLPIPFSNLLPALTVVVVSVSVSERDGLMLCVGGLLFVITLIFFAGIFFGGVGAIAWLKAHFEGFFDPQD